MGRPKKSTPVLHEPDDDFNQEAPDEEPTRVIEEEEQDDAPEANGSGHNKTALIREAVQAGYEKPARGVEFIKNKYGVEIDSKYYSIVKGKLGKSGDEKAETSPAPPAPRKASTPSPSNGSGGAVPASLFDDLKHLRQMKDRYGDEFEKLVDAIG